MNKKSIDAAPPKPKKMTTPKLEKHTVGDRERQPYQLSFSTPPATLEEADEFEAWFRMTEEAGMWRPSQSITDKRACARELFPIVQSDLKKKKKKDVAKQQPSPQADHQSGPKAQAKKKKVDMMDLGPDATPKTNALDSLAPTMKKSRLDDTQDLTLDALPASSGDICARIATLHKVFQQGFMTQERYDAKYDELMALL
jgi:hypothetical protein